MSWRSTVVPRALLEAPMRPLLRRTHAVAAAALLCLTALYGCGGGDNLSPSEPFPDVSGSYNVEGGFDGATRSEASITGSLTLTQASRQSGTLGGTATLTFNISGDITTVSDVPLQDASVTPGSVVSFRLGSSAQGVTWTFTGNRAGKTITGRHTLATTSGTVSGDWTGRSP
jgi:hypothetical protein